jgi:hypothetical protein
MKDVWFLLHLKESTDGRELPEYVGRTASVIQAQAFLDSHKSPYASVRVDAYWGQSHHRHFTPGEDIKSWLDL